MAEIGYFLGSEEHGPRELVAYAQQAEQAGFRSLWLSDHFHPWLDSQGQSPFVWSVIGGVATTTRLEVTTAVTCPTIRIHPAIVAHAAATCALLLDGRFRLGIGSGENLNEHILGDRWPPADIRLAMLEEAVEVMRKLWTGTQVDHHGEHYVVENARLYSVPEEPPPVLVSAFGPKSIGLAARIADGYLGVKPVRELLERYDREGGKGPKVGGMKVCWAADESTGRKTAHELWRNEVLPGQLGQELPTPAHFEQVSQLVTEEMVAEAFPCGPDPERHVAAIRRYFDAGYDVVHIQQMGKDQAGFMEFHRRELAPRLGL
jgi:G6PDH family F420-dependent oxidoreductase